MLDKKRSYGEIFGKGPAKYEQDGKCFDVNGNDLSPVQVVEGKPVVPIVLVEAERPDEELSVILKKRIEVTDTADPMYLDRQELLKVMKLFKNLYKADIKYSIRMDRVELIHTLREAINDLES